MHKISLSLLFVLVVVMGCTTNKFSQPSNLMFQSKTEIMSKKLLVKRDDLLCKDETKSQQFCPVDLYIDNFNVGKFYSGNSAQFFLQNRSHNIKVKNCNAVDCKTCEITATHDDFLDQELLISLDENETPYFKDVSGKLKCS